MTTVGPTFNPKQFELRGETNRYLNPTQKDAVQATEGRVASQLNFIAQMLGWNGPNYWGNLPDTQDQKRQLLGGTFGVFNSYIPLEIRSIRNWDETIEIVKEPELQIGQTLLLNQTYYTIETITEEGDSQFLTIDSFSETFQTEVTQYFLFANIPSRRPAPFYRPSVNGSADNAFICGVTDGNLVLYPGWDTRKTLPYKINVLVPGSRYFFDQLVFLSLDNSLNKDITCTYDSASQYWYLDIPEDIVTSDLGITAYLVWDYWDPNASTNASLQVLIQPWYDPSDWTGNGVLQNFTGAWGNKGGYLPFNLCFDSLSIHGFDERKSLILSDVDRLVTFSELVTYVNSQNLWTNINSFFSPTSNLPVLSFNNVVFYYNGQLLSSGSEIISETFKFTYVKNTIPQTYSFDLSPFNIGEKIAFPKIEISNTVSSNLRYDVTPLILSGLQYYFSPNNYDAETPLRLWKAQALQVAETVNHLVEKNYSNPLVADENSGPGPENWEKFFVRLPPTYGRNAAKWQKVNLICQDFSYWGSSVDPENMECPPEDQIPRIYEELVLYPEKIGTYRYIYCESYLYSNLGYFTNIESGADYENSGVYPAFDAPYDGWDEASLVSYAPLHERQIDTSSPIGEGFGKWKGIYVQKESSSVLSGYLVNDLDSGVVTEKAAPIWDASIYLAPPTCSFESSTYSVDSNHYKVCYAYFTADLSCAEEAFFDVNQEISWRYPDESQISGYLVPS